MASVVLAQRYSFVSYGPEKGLTNPAAMALAQDRQGFVWVGTENGLFRYDGHRFQRFFEKAGLPSPAVTSLYEDKSGVLWIGTLKGLAAASPDRSKVTTRLPDSFIFKVTGDGEGHILLGTPRGLFMLANPADPAGKFALHPASVPSARAKGEPPPVRAVTAVTTDRQNSLWFSQGTVIVRVTPGREPERFVFEGTGPGAMWRSATLTATGEIWFRSDQKLAQFRPESQKFVEHDLQAPISSRPVFHLGSDRAGRLLIPSTLGLMTGRPGDWGRAARRHGLPANDVLSVLEDREGSIWVGTANGLVRWLGYGEWQGYTEFEGLPADNVETLVSVGDRRIVVADGILGVGEKSGARWNFEPVAPHELNRITAVAPDADGRHVLLATPGRLLRLDPVRKAWHPVKTATKLPNVFFLYRDGANTWFGTKAGIFRAEGDAPPVPVALPAGLVKTDKLTVAAIHRDSRGVLWFGTYEGLLRLNPDGAWKAYRPADGLRSAWISQILETRDGALWLRYFDGNGITRLTLGATGDIQLSHFGRAQGIPSDKCTALATDAAGHLWIGHDQGVTRLTWNGGQLQTLTLDENEGMMGQSVNSSALLADPSGGLWTGTSRGLSRYTPGTPPKAVTPS